MTRWFEKGLAPLGRFVDGEMISFDEETLYELADRDYGLDVWVLLPSHAANEMIENAVHSNSSPQAVLKIANIVS